MGAALSGFFTSALGPSAVPLLLPPSTLIIVGNPDSVSGSQDIVRTQPGVSLEELTLRTARPAPSQGAPPPPGSGRVPKLPRNELEAKLTFGKAQVLDD